MAAWGHVFKRLELAEAPHAIRANLQDALIARGRWCYLYQPVKPTTPGVVECTCVKASSNIADKTCQSCHGVGLACGYLKFMHETMFWASAEHASFTLTDTVLNTTWKTNLLVLNEGELTGTIETQDKAYENPDLNDWSLHLTAYRRATGSTFTLEYSINAGADWEEVTLTEVASPGIGFTGTIDADDLGDEGDIRFRVTITRLDANDDTSCFEILRMRRLKTEVENRHIQVERGTDFTSGAILMLSPWFQEQNSLEPGRGLLFEHMGNRTWTAPLDFFDTTLTPDTPVCKIDDGDAGPHPFYHYARGIQSDTMYVMTKGYYSDRLLSFTHQFFDDRRAQTLEAPYSKVW